MAQAQSSSLPLIAVVLILAVLGAIATQPQPSQPQNTLAASTVPPEQEGVREIHWVTNRDGCTRLAQRFRQQGRQIKLVERIGNPYGSGNFQLRVGCVFEGPDAQPGYFSRDSRYEATHEWTHP